MRCPRTFAHTVYCSFFFLQKDFCHFVFHCWLESWVWRRNWAAAEYRGVEEALGGKCDLTTKCVKHARSKAKCVQLARSTGRSFKRAPFGWFLRVDLRARDVKKNKPTYVWSDGVTLETGGTCLKRDYARAFCLISRWRNPPCLYSAERWRLEVFPPLLCSWQHQDADSPTLLTAFTLIDIFFSPEIPWFKDPRCKGKKYITCFLKSTAR